MLTSAGQHNRYRRPSVLSVMDPADDKHEPTFEEMCEIVAPIAKKYGMISVYLFGSRARGDNKAGSDYDFCIRAPEGCGLFIIGSFLSDLEDALGTEVDIISENAIYKNPYFREEMLRERRVVFGA